MFVVRALLLPLTLFSLHAAMAADAPKTAETRAGIEQRLQAAQQRLDEAAREVANLSMALSDDAMPRGRFFTSDVRQRAQLGIAIGTPGDGEGKDGVEVLSVSPGGAAASAGLQSGDVLTEVNGQSLKQRGDDSSRERLLQIMREVKPGDKVTVEYRRGEKTVTTSVTARAPADRMFNLPFPPALVRGQFEGGMPHMFFANSDGVFGATEMVALTPKLGQYFGTDKGLLVVRAPGDDRLKIEEGDVIVDIDGRVPENAVHAARILGSYEAGEKLKLNVLRMKKRITLEFEVPADTSAESVGPARGRSVLPGPPGLPMPSTAAPSHTIGPGAMLKSAEDAV